MATYSAYKEGVCIHVPGKEALVLTSEGLCVHMVGHYTKKTRHKQVMVPSTSCARITYNPRVHEDYESNRN